MERTIQEKFRIHQNLIVNLLRIINNIAQRPLYVLWGLETPKMRVKTRKN